MCPPEARHIRRLGNRRIGWLGSDAPSRDGGIGTDQAGLAFTGSAQQQGSDARRLGRELQSAGCGQADALRQFRDDAGQAAMPQSVFHHQQGVAPPSLGVDHPVRMQSGGGEARREEIVLFKHPEHFAFDTGKDAGGEHGGCGPVLDVGAGSGDLVQRAAGESAAGEGGIQTGQAEG